MPQTVPGLHELIAPVERMGQDPPVLQPEQEGIALCLSGGGYRAMLFHVGAILRLNELGYLGKLERISSVSGGSITAGVLGLNWNRLIFNANGVAQNLDECFTTPLRTMGLRTIDASSIIEGVLLPGSVSDKIRKSYQDCLFGAATLQDLPDKPRFVINATNVQSMALCRFSKPYMWDYRVGKMANPKIELAAAVAASSAFPPVLSPAELHFDSSDFEPNTGTDLQKEPYTTDMVLTDGGVYDNLGLETAWKRYSTILVSDGGGATLPEPEPKHDWARHAYRILNIVDNQVRSLRKRQLIGSFKAGLRKGTYWGIRTDIKKYSLQDALPCPFEKTILLASIPTRLKRLESEQQKDLINWGYAVCDAAMRAHMNLGQAVRPAFPL
jgi:NTE family protein